MPLCEYCEEREAKPRHAGTAYSWESTLHKYSRRPSRYNQIEVDISPQELEAWEEKHNPNPNRDVILCDPCAEDYYAFWGEQWKEYYSGLL